MAAPRRRGENQSGTVAAPSAAAAPEMELPTLIRFDQRTLAFLAGLLLFLVVGTAFKVHGSSIGVWNQSFPDRPANAGVLLGKPKIIRIDEWAFMTPAMMGQMESRPSLAAANPSWGPARATLIMNLPVRHWAMIVRPQYWGFFVLDLERAFSFYWNMKAVLLLGGLFLLLMLLTENHFGVSLLGTAWVFFSGFMQWWYSTPAMLPEMVGCVALLVVAIHYLALSPRVWVVGASALALVICLLDAALSLYPPFQVPLLYLGVAILVGSLGPRLAASRERGHLLLRIGAAVLVLAAVAALLALYYRDAWHAINLMLGTVYPGSRRSMGGEVGWAQIFSGFYGPFMSDGHVPPQWFNACEASNFLLLFPVPAAALIWRAWRRSAVGVLEWSLMAYIAVVLSWMTLGWPSFLAHASAFELSQGTRSLLGLGLASALLCCIFLAKERGTPLRGLGPGLVAAISILTAMLLYSREFNRATDTFAAGHQVALVSLLATAASYLLLTRRRVAFAACLLLPSVWSYGLVNPVGVGLGPILDTNLFRQIAPLIRRDPAAEWAVYGHHTLADFVKSAGARVFNGTKIVPPLADLRVIDPSSSAMTIYNRYAHIELEPNSARSEVTFTLHRGDWYTIHIDPTNDAFRRLGIRYVALPYAITDPGFLARTTLVLDLPDIGVRVYRYAWSTDLSPSPPPPIRAERHR